MRQFILLLSLLAADQQIDACNKIIALKVFAGEKLATSTKSATRSEFQVWKAPPQWG